MYFVGGFRRKEDTGTVEMFFFPDEENMPFSSSASQTYTDSQSSEDDFESEYCVLEPEMGIGYLVGVPERILCYELWGNNLIEHFLMPG